jgi:hypothetical protein
MISCPWSSTSPISNLTTKKNNYKPSFHSPVASNNPDMPFLFNYILLNDQKYQTPLGLDEEAKRSCAIEEIQ